MATSLSIMLIIALLALAHLPLLIGEAMAKRGAYPSDAEHAGRESEIAAAMRAQAEKSSGVLPFA